MIGVSWWSILPAPGDEPATDPTPPTFTKNVAPILQARCQNCHRRGQIGPFALETYAQAKKRAVDIAAVAGERSMPPWKPKPGVGPKLKHDQSLTAAEIDTLEAWAEAGAPLGDAKHMPPPRQFAEGWKLGKPDLVLECTEDFKIPASGPDIYRCFVIPTNLRRELFISAIDVQPGNARVVHHIIMYTDVSGIGRQRDKAEPGPGYISFEGPGIPVSSGLGFWGAGSEPHHLPDGVGLRLPKQSDVILQVHYHPTGKPETDRTRLGLYLSRKPVKQALHWNDASSFDFQLPAGKAEVKVEATWFVPVSVEALAVAPHMHSLGRNMTMSVTYPDGHSLDLIHIDDWDPSWQTNYYFQKPIPLPAGSVVKVIAHFDNSDHPRNPNQPPKLVKSGQGVNDEMCVGYIAVVKTGQDLTAPRARDDLFEIFARQRVRNFRKQFAKRPR
ncbi:MAG: hypothetical protein ABI353_15970 [Isosphaeraceae bacterium]